MRHRSVRSVREVVAPKASFVSTSFEPTGEMTATLKGNLTMHGVTRPVEIEVTQVGAGPSG